MKPNHPLKRGRQLEDSTIILMKILSDKRRARQKKQNYKTRKRKLTRRQSDKNSEKKEVQPGEENSHLHNPFAFPAQSLKRTSR